MTKDEFQAAVDDAITDCISKDYSFGTYARKVTDAVWPVLKAAEKERDGFKRECFGHISDNSLLRAKIEAMEKQEPVGIQHRVPSVNSKGECVGYSMWKDGKGLDHWPHRSLYLAPGAQPAPSVPEITIEMEHAFYEKVTVTRVGSIVGLAEGIKAAMLAAAPEAKP